MKNKRKIMEKLKLLNENYERLRLNENGKMNNYGKVQKTKKSKSKTMTDSTKELGSTKQKY